MNSVRLKHTESSPAGSTRPRVVSVVSGKGGVGKSVVAMNLAERLAARGARVLIVDADEYCGNLHILANLDVRAGLQHVRAGRVSLGDAVVPVAERLDLLASVPVDELASPQASPDSSSMPFPADQIRRYDAVIVDHASGASPTTVETALAADTILMVLVPELTSIADCYGLYKQLQRRNSAADCRLLLNRAASVGEAEEIIGRFQLLSERFLGGMPTVAGALSEDDMYRQSVARQRPLAGLDPQAPAVRELDDLAEAIAPGIQPEVTHVKTINKTPETADIRG